MYLIPIGWMYVVLMMAVAEATNTNGSVLGAFFTFLLYGVLPSALVFYILSTPQRRRDREAREAALAEQALKVAADEAGGHSPQAASESATARSGSGAAPPSLEPDAGGQAPADAVTPVRKEP